MLTMISRYFFYFLRDHIDHKLDIFCTEHGGVWFKSKILVPDNTVHKFTTKCHKMDEKRTHFGCTFSHQYLIFLLSHYTHLQLNCALCWFFYPGVDIETCTAILSFFWVWLQPKQIVYILLDLFFFHDLGTHPKGGELLY